MKREALQDRGVEREAHDQEHYACHQKRTGRDGAQACEARAERRKMKRTDFYEQIAYGTGEDGNNDQ